MLAARQNERPKLRFRSDRMILTHLGSEVLAEAGRLSFEIAEDGLRLKI